MIKSILNKLPRKQAKSVENRDGGRSVSSSKAETTLKSNTISSSRITSCTAPVPNGTNGSIPHEPVDAREDGTARPMPYEAQPSFNDVPSSEKHNLFLRKLSLCCVVFDFTDPTKNLKEKGIKRQTLIEIVDYVASASGTFNEIAMQEFIRMVSVNLFRTLLSQPRENKVLQAFDVEEEEPLMDPSWPHLQVVYECLLKLVTSSAMDMKLAKRCITRSFLVKFIDLFDSEDPREREYLKTILHRIYGKFMVHRPFIRKVINNIFYRFIFETEKYSGIAELLEILGSIINGLALPLKEEHKVFLVRALIPLHKPNVSVYHQQLSYCITQFVEKDCKLADTVIRGLLKYWPVTNSTKEVMFLGEVEEVLEVTQSPEFLRCMVPLFRQIACSLRSSHFQVAERALLLWNNDHIANLIKQNRKVILPIIFDSLEKNASHWNQGVKSLTLNVRKIFSDTDPELFAQCSHKFKEDEAQEEELKQKRDAKWKQLEEIASSNEATTIFSQQKLR